MIDLLTIGDSTIDMYMKIGDDGVSESGGQICFFHGDKVLVDQLESSIAGNAINVAAGARELGLEVSIYTELGDDTNGEKIVEELGTRGIGTSYCNVNEGVTTNVHTVIVHGSDRTIFSYHGKRTYKFQDWEKPKWIYYTSLGYGFEEFQSKLVNYRNENPDIGIAVNPGSIQMKMGLEKMRNILQVADVLIVNREEALRLLAEDNGNTSGADADIENVHKNLQKLGPKLTLITDGKKGATAYAGNKVVKQEVYSDERPLKDKTGAGDAFSSGFISAIIHGKPLEEALKWGAINSGNAIKEIGAINGLTTLEEMTGLVS
jgi:sugar/nucleoside kinase (ribokinase family)